MIHLYVYGALSVLQCPPPVHGTSWDCMVSGGVWTGVVASEGGSEGRGGRGGGRGGEGRER